MNDEPLAELKSLYSTLSPEELLIAQDNLDGYLEIAWEIFADTQPSVVTPAGFPELPSHGTIKERSILPTN